jgi:hypothetical protein
VACILEATCNTQVQTALLILENWLCLAAGVWRACSAQYTGDMWERGVVSPWEHKNELLGFHKSAEFFDWLHGYQPINMVTS